ncbi:amylo-alpha-1,6-glucosidase [Luteococcus japonicus]|uniref:Amylo-alpha-1,6-glucosidase n=1 Tax=Luteococcus japonicus TaxID=33984 RepID=A0A3N1ZV76_9ACTN|nr:glycogen debranching N-terminal domain-containing protein [Luteococcus japonicus]ROR54753.1 amylo-alpha-1,6-glucosidase [Luteococcus japonicus]
MQQPFLTHHSAVLAAPVQAWSALDGQADGLVAERTVEGVYCADSRVVSQLEVTSPSHALEHIGTDERGGARAAFQYVLRTPELGVDPALLLNRVRQVDGTGISEHYELSTASLESLDVDLRVRLRPDATAMQEIKSGLHGQDVAAMLTDRGVTFPWRDEKTTATLTTDATCTLAGDDIVLDWWLTLPPRGTAAVNFRLDLVDAAAPFVACTAPALVPPGTDGTNAALDRLLTTSFADINGLRMAHPATPDEGFLAAGAPWYFTLFGRDSLISARNLVPHDLSVARGTLKVLAQLQGDAADVDSAQQPGKILHEVRQEPLELALSHQGQVEHQMSLPPLYYGTVDATPLWIMLLDEAEAAGLDEAEVRSLLPALKAALAWLRDFGDADGDGFLEYRDESGHGLANQGWKDSGDSIRFADGTMAAGSVALAEVQGYAHAAALGGARLLEKYESDAAAAEQWRAWAAALAERFRAKFWTSDDLGRYPVLALNGAMDADGSKPRVDGVASNMGHLLGTGILSEDEARLVVDRLMHPTMASGYGIRTMSTTNGGYWPLSYHVGSVWTHDTAFIIDQMLRDGFRTEARELATQLLRAAEGFSFRMPELFGGMSADEVFPPQPYPASCRPQAWAATSSVVIARALA